MRLRSLPVSAWRGVQRLEASSFRARLLGLAHLQELPAGVGLHFPRTRSLHTLGMRFALDLVWLDADGEVVRVDRGVGRRRMVGCREAASVLELAAGGADRLSGPAVSGRAPASGTSRS